MLDAETKLKIDNCRDVLVGKIPDPKSQVEQITIALIYKFMDDMDQESIYMGGKPSFFTGEFEKYSWSSIFDPRISGFELLNLYGEALVKMNQNPNIPQLFRDIFKNAFLPYRDPETLRLFLKEIRGFTYDHSERLGDAFEYLLSVLSSQGEAGQFRTPRHIIDFIVKIIDPQLNHTILDPACGTAGFLISAYKHILKNNPKLSITQKKRLMNNFVGYDISPDMVRLSLVNMYLHGFPQPHIREYDTLTYEDRWNDTFDVIMANPPFMTPKGGIRPHSRFSIKAKRSEVLFVDYIAEHLNPGGRAGVIIPEGIIFQSQKAYKALRKMLVENHLWAVVSLPAGVFNPYSGVKTSILLMDKSLAKRIDNILFVKIENDGFDLGAQRRPIDKNDLPAALKFLNIYKSKAETYKSTPVSPQACPGGPFAHAVEKSKIAESGDWNLTGERYRNESDLRMSTYELVELAKICDLVKDKPEAYVGKKRYFSTGSIQGELHSKDFQLIEYGTKPNRANLLPKKNDVGFAKMKNTNKSVLVDDYYTDAIFSTGFAFLRAKQEIIPKFLFYLVANEIFQNKKDTIAVDGIMGGIRQSDILNTQIPLPPLDVQEKIVAEINSYQKIIDGARQVVDNYKPTIKIDSDWPMIELEKVAIVQSGGTPRRNVSKFWGGKIPWVGSTVCKDDFVYESEEFITEEGLENSAAKMFKPKTTMIALVGATIGKTGFLTFSSTTNQNIAGLYPINEKQLLPEFLFYVAQTLYPNFMLLGSGKFRMANLSFIKSQKIPLPPLEEQKQIVSQIEAEQQIVNDNKKLIEMFEQKIKDKIAEVWGFATSQATVEIKADKMADSGLLIAEVAERYRTDASVACLVLQHFKERVKPIREFHLQKYTYIAQQHLKLPIVSEFQPMAAGPWSSAFKNYACAYARQQQWFFLKGRNVEPGKALKAGTAQAEKILGRQRGKVLQLLDDLKRFGDSGLERWATILMVVSQLKAARKAVTRWNIQEAIDNWAGKRNKEWFTKISVSKAIDGMNQKGWIKLIGE